MRVWDIQPEFLCRKHLLGEHSELHAIWAILTQNRSGYKKHPETLRWEGKLAALYSRHESETAEILKRGWNHKSPLDKTFAVGKVLQDVFVHSIAEQKQILKNKKCDCRV